MRSQQFGNRNEGKVKFKTIVGCVVMLSSALAVQAQSPWQQKVKDELPLLGHRNWIVVVDSAYPLQSGAGVETVETDADQLAVIDYVLDSIKNSEHVQPIVHTDAELQYLQESEAPGVDRYRQQLKNRLAGVSADSVLHQTLIDQVNDLGKSFHVLILKTNMTIPYTSVFLQLDCKYWGAESDAKLRARMKAADHAPAASSAH
jgi:RbsD / FucU transport protein family